MKKKEEGMDYYDLAITDDNGEVVLEVRDPTYPW